MCSALMLIGLDHSRSGRGGDGDHHRPARGMGKQRCDISTGRAGENLVLRLRIFVLFEQRRLGINIKIIFLFCLLS